jgi:hypothetical protein
MINSWRCPKRATLACFVAALGEMKREQPMLSEPIEALAKVGEFIGCSEMSLRAAEIGQQERMEDPFNCRIQVKDMRFRLSFDTRAGI